MRTRTTPAHASVRRTARRPTLPKSRDGRNRRTVRTRWTAGVTAALATLAAAALLGGTAATADEQISSTGPLTSIRITNDLNCAVNHAGDDDGEWYGDTACGTFVAVGGTLYGPALVPAGPQAGETDGYQAFTVSTDEAGQPNNQSITGTGESGNPFKVTTTVQLGETGLSLTEIDTYLTGQESYTTRVTLHNAGSGAMSPIIYRGGDCFLQDSDQGLGDVQNGNAPVCKAAPGSADPDRIEAMYPLTAGSHYIEGSYSCVWQAIESQQALPDERDVVESSSEGSDEEAARPAARRITPEDVSDTPTDTPTDDPTDEPQPCAPSADGTDPYDNGLGLSWSPGLPGDSSTTVNALTVFSPLGAAPLTFSKTADTATAAAGGVDGYQITVSNPGSADEVLTSITDTLPDSFGYDSGSSTGATTDDPTVSGQDVTWTGRFDVPGADDDGTPGSLTLHFAVDVGDDPGEYYNSVTGAGPGITVVAANRVAPVTVQAAPQRPSAGDDNYAVDENAVLTVAPPGVLSNDTDPNGASLFVTSDGGTAPQHGTLTFDQNGDGGFTYAPESGFHGIDTFTYLASNGEQTSDPATVTITVNAVNHAPVATKDSYTTPEDNVLRVSASDGVLANDSDPDGDPLSAVLQDHPSKGSVTLNDNGSFVYTPAANVNGMDSFTYYATDGALHSDTVTVTITVTPVNDGIQAVDDTYTVQPGQAFTIDTRAAGVLGNDVNVDTGPDDLTASLVSGPSSGTLHLNGDGTFTFTPLGRTDATFTYQASNSQEETSNVATVHLNVSTQDRPPVGTSDSYTTPEDSPLVTGPDTGNPGVLANDSDPDGDSLTAVRVTGSGPSHGSLDLDPNGTFTYTPDDNYNGPDSFAYRASDGTDTSDPVTVDIEVEPRADQPIAAADDYSTTRNVTRNVPAANGVLANDTSVDGLPLTAVLQDDGNQPDGSAHHGTITLNADGSLRYVPNPAFVGSDVFTYVAREFVNEGHEDSAPATITIHVTAVNHAPVAVDDSYSTPHDTTLTVVSPGVLDNDSDPDGNVLSAVLVAGTSHGTLKLSPNGRVVYRPDAGFSGTDSFRYRATDGLLTSPTVTVTITVTPPAPPAPTSAVPVPPTSAPSGTPTPTAQPTEVPTDVIPPSATAANPTTPSKTPATSAPVSPPSSTGPTGAAVKALRLTAPSVIPGGALRAAGTGCAPNSAIALTIAGRAAGSGTAGPDGHFNVPVDTTGLAVGNYPVTATCGDRQLVADVALVYVTANSNAPTAQALVVAAALAFFMLLLGLVIRRPTS